MDNGPAFITGATSAGFFFRWIVWPLYGTAYRASGNRLAERNHSTIKSVAEISGICPLKAVFWYNS